ncbi:unnamed protein product, partial [Laminaria digitata]
MSRRAVRTFTLGLVVLFVASAGMLVWGAAAYDEPGAFSEDVTVVLPRGSSVNRISQILESRGVLAQPNLFRFVVRASGQSGSLRAGEYLIPAGTSMREVTRLLTSGETVVRRVTSPEGLSSIEVLRLVAQDEALVGDIPRNVAEGSLLPETYHYAYGDTREEVIRRMQQAMTDLIEEIWPSRAADLPFDTPSEAVTLASIVEKETAVPEERARVAGVFVNRLRRGMRLQSDPTVVYALTNGAGPLGRRLTRSDLATDSPFNTYRVRGLPPAPIANPGRAALEAVLQPADTDDLYFVADGDGGHAFAETLQEHQRNVRRWRQIRD